MASATSPEPDDVRTFATPILSARSLASTKMRVSSNSNPSATPPWLAPIRSILLEEEYSQEE
jgi:hypothetical protein